MKKVHFVGIGGAGMAPLAGLLLQSCREVMISGSDLEFNSKCRTLQESGADIHIGHQAEFLPDDAECVVYTSAAAEDNPELQKACKLGIKRLRRGEFLAEFATRFRRPVAVSGTHGKSSISALLASSLEYCGATPGYMIGAEVRDMPSFAVGRGEDLFVTEADESDGTHTLNKNFLGIVPNVEDDHEWSLGGRDVLEKNFRTFAENSRKLLYAASPLCDKLFAGHPDATRLENLPGEFAGHYGFQAVNAFIVREALRILGISDRAADEAVRHYPQVLRRMTVHFQEKDITVIEDYAHHPTEVRNSIDLLRRKFPDAHLRIFFQPHRFARLEKYFEDFAAELCKADSLFIAPVFAAWSESGSVSSADLAVAANGKCCSGNYLECAELLSCDLPENSVIAVLGAGDVNQVLPLLYRILSARNQ